MVNIDLDALDLKDLKALQKDVAKAIDQYAAKQRQAALEAVEALVRERGFSSLAELTGNAPAKKSRGTQPPKYRHPDNPSLTWSGRGRQPAWLKDALDAGKSREDFRIDA